MSKDNLIRRTEQFVKQSFLATQGILLIAHDFQHVDRVRHTAMFIAKREGYKELEKLEIAALLHDVGLTRINDKDERINHGPAGARIAEEFLRNSSDFKASDIEQISDAIKYHSLPPWIVHEYLQGLGGKGKLIKIIRDADLLDGLGAVGLMRAFSSKYFLAAYNPLNIKGDTCEVSQEERAKKFGGMRPPVNTVIDQVNQQIRNFDNLHTNTAKEMAISLIRYMKDFIVQLEKEILVTIK